MTGLLFKKQIVVNQKNKNKTDDNYVYVVDLWKENKKYEILL